MSSDYRNLLHFPYLSTRWSTQSMNDPTRRWVPHSRLMKHIVCLISEYLSNISMKLMTEVCFCNFDVLMLFRCYLLYYCKVVSYKQCISLLCVCVCMHECALTYVLVHTRVLACLSNLSIGVHWGLCMCLWVTQTKTFRLISKVAPGNYLVPFSQMNFQMSHSSPVSPHQSLHSLCGCIQLYSIH